MIVAILPLAFLVVLLAPFVWLIRVFAFSTTQ